MPVIKSPLDIKSKIFKLKLEECCCNSNLITDDGHDSKVHFPILASNNVWWSDLEDICDEDGLHDCSSSELSDFVNIVVWC